MKEGVLRVERSLPLGIHVALVARHVVRKLSVSRPIRKRERRIEWIEVRKTVDWTRERKINGG